MISLQTKTCLSQRHRWKTLPGLSSVHENTARYMILKCNIMAWIYYWLKYTRCPGGEMHLNRGFRFHDIEISLTDCKIECDFLHKEWSSTWNEYILPKMKSGRSLISWVMVNATKTLIRKFRIWNLAKQCPQAVK